MAVKQLSNGLLTGVSGDTKPTTYPAGTRFFETNTGNEFYYTGSAWTAMPGGGGGGLTSPAQIDGVNFADVGITNSNSPYTVLDTKTVIRVDASAGNVTMNLPSAVGIAGRLYKIYRTDIASSTNLVTIDPNGTETIDGSLIHILYSAEWIHIESDGANWVSLARTQPPSKLFIKGATANRKYVAGTFGNFGNLTTSSTGLLADKLYAVPLIVEKTTQFDLISFRVTVLSTAGSARVGIYRDNGNMYPSALIFESGSIDTSTGSTSATRDTTITSSLQIFQPGVYWLTIVLNNTTGTFSCLGSASVTLTFTGSDAAMASNNSGWAYSVTHTFGALPDPYPAGGAINITAPAATNPVPAVGLRPI